MEGHRQMEWLHPAATARWRLRDDGWEFIGLLIHGDYLTDRKRKMLGRGGTNGNTIFPGFVEENRVQYDNNTMPQLQLFGHVPMQCGSGVGTINYIGNRHAPTDDLLSIELEKEEERNSSVTSACENMKNNAPVMLSLGSAVKMEIDRQTDEFGRYIKLQEESILKGVREINQRHTVSLLNALEKGVNRKLHEKELEIENLNRKNKELGDKIKQVAMEAQSWHYRAKYNESVVNVLKSNIQQLVEQGTAHAREGSGDSEVDDAISYSNHPRIISGSGNQGGQNRLIQCRGCNAKGASVLILPCRHLCLCTDCEGLANVCPICQVMKTASVHVYM
ncbi:hypothetical protein DH2020_042750 [Rehmannia glutinosa]|uniref:RING-type domain-containing protein n=1 Tax=Rehmannia glutinosa TaxID=99300 RepID=A0ABR0UMJ2_REHGL